MNAITAELLTVAKKLDNYAEDATGGGLWLTTQEYRVTVPADKRWYLQYGFTNRDVNATGAVYVFNVSDEGLAKLMDEGAATGGHVFPDPTYVSVTMPLVLDAGDYIKITFGVAQGAGAHCSAVVLEIDV